MICEVLGIGWIELQETPRDVITYRIALSNVREEIKKALAPRSP